MPPWGFLSHGRQISFILFYSISFYCKQTRTKWSWFFFFLPPCLWYFPYFSTICVSFSRSLSLRLPRARMRRAAFPSLREDFHHVFLYKTPEIIVKEMLVWGEEEGKKILLTSTSRTISPTAEDAPDFFLPRLPTTGWMDGWMDACVKRKLPQKILSRNRRCYDVHQQPWGSILHVRTLYFSLFLKF